MGQWECLSKRPAIITAVSCAVLTGVTVWTALQKRKAKRKRCCKWPVTPLLDGGHMCKEAERLRIVIVGAGYGGTFAAMWLRQRFGARVEVTVIQSGPIGGRCPEPLQVGTAEQIQEASQATMPRYECGAAIISELNEYILDMMKTFNLSQKARTFVPMAVWDGSRVLFQEAFMTSAMLSSLVSTIRVLRRYTLSSLLRFKRSFHSEQGMPDFPHLYQLLQEGKSFAHPREMLLALSRGGGSGCLDLTQVSSKECFARMGISSLLVNELVQGGMRSNYGGQSLSCLHAFVGLISVAGGIASTCFRIKGGNAQVAQRALETSEAKVIRGTARVVKRCLPPAGEDAAHYEVSYDDATGEWMCHGAAPPEAAARNLKVMQADVVVLAHHLSAGALKLQGIDTEVKPEPLQRCCTHFLRGSLKAEYFGLAPGEPVPLEILTVGETPFYSIGVQAPVDASKDEMLHMMLDLRAGGVGTFKVFASTELSERDLSAYFDVVPGTLRVVDWLGYPAYSSPADFTPFVLAPGLIYLNAVETMGSALEMSAIAARNALNLVQEWYPQGCRR
mmetsp:Transcript_7802/g.17125  ORF Transcript_7802/g.17125 Transcript_7802/m.17125 type:complete len:561 (+) Transcript_7802:96-1778(+)